jgi:hypothetical protein
MDPAVILQISGLFRKILLSSDGHDKEIRNAQPLEDDLHALDRSNSRPDDHLL